jgi:hypothetical protein
MSDQAEGPEIPRLSPTVEAAFLAVQRAVDAMQAAGWTRDAIEAEVTRRMRDGMARGGMAMPDADLRYTVKLLLVLCTLHSDDEVRRVLPLLIRVQERN